MKNTIKSLISLGEIISETNVTINDVEEVFVLNSKFEPIIKNFRDWFFNDSKEPVVEQMVIESPIVETPVIIEEPVKESVEEAADEANETVEETVEKRFVFYNDRQFIVKSNGEILDNYGKIMPLVFYKNEYRVVVGTDKYTGTPVYVRVAPIVAKAYRINSGGRTGVVIGYKDGVPSNCRPENLHWIERAEKDLLAYRINDICKQIVKFNASLDNDIGIDKVVEYYKEVQAEPPVPRFQVEQLINKSRFKEYSDKFFEYGNLKPMKKPEDGLDILGFYRQTNDIETARKLLAEKPVLSDEEDIFIIYDAIEILQNDNEKVNIDSVTEKVYDIYERPVNDHILKEII